MIYFFALIIQLIIIKDSWCLVEQNRWIIEWLAGDAFCFKTPLTIKQSGYDNIKLTAKYKTNSFKQPIYYSIRFSKWNDKRGWEIELIHLKIELVSRPPEIQKFEISHGYRAYRNKTYTYSRGNSGLSGSIKNNCRLHWGA